MPVTKGPGIDGGDGNDSGDIWIFVQDVPSNIEKLTVMANGGKGGRGGDTTEHGQTGGKGGNGGKSGNVEILYGSVPMQVYLDFPTLRKQFWLQRALDFQKGYSCRYLPTYVTETMQMTLNLYLGLGNAMRDLASILSDRRLASPVVETTLAKLEVIQHSTDAPPRVHSSAISELINARKEIQKVVQIYRHPNVDRILQDLSRLLEDLTPQRPSDLSEILGDIFQDVNRDLGKLKDQIKWKCESIPGPGGVGGTSGTPGDPPGEHGKEGEATGRITVKNLHLNGDAEDLEATQAFAFPDQCQMLLNRANRYFFADSNSAREQASDMYHTLLNRLQFLDKLDEQKTSPLAKAYDDLERTWKVTISGTTQLRSIFSEGKSRFNRLLLGQDMFGHTALWVPRMSFLHYHTSVGDQLRFLEKQEGTVAAFEKALEEGHETTIFIKDSIKELDSSKQAAKSQINLLEGSNGPLSTVAYKIETFTPILKEKRENVRKKIDEIEWIPQFNPSLLLDGFTTLITASFDRATLSKFIEFGYQDYLSTTQEKGMSTVVEKKYIIHQLTTTADTLESFSEALNTNKDNTIQLDDPGALKVFATKNAIEKLLDEFSSAIPEEQRKAISEALKDYVESVLTRNNAVVEYNTSVLLLLDSYQTLKYCEEQIKNLGNPTIKIDPSLPSVIFWLRKMRDALRLRLLQYLNYESRAIKYWGLFDNLPSSLPGPLIDHIALGNQQQDLQSSFESALEIYSISARGIWPPKEDDVGRVYQLTAEQRSALTTPSDDGDYITFVTIGPDNAQGIFQDWIDIRLREVRVWLFGVEIPVPDYVGRKHLSIHITHQGDESIIDPRGDRFEFSHDSLNVPFVYDITKVSNIKEVPGGSVFTRADLEHDFSIGGIPKESSRAPLGPFATWRLRISTKAHPGIKMDGLTEAYIEFRGSYRLLWH
ncbi:hypothetical protein BGW36DRAFT_329197 [Talaromyces proteolyticus]|uniref:Uncharacterized protein n=1 Tax=Talaromyces proteolyticus TaxID=1131652 RepID=A0AAD4PUV3_9EURO|nr:uncharacterized protein BGW36DRAFT_329197 [Talaromyces proteolyticus]KAH8689861.1 hypothetical protein BGW36DRAFT_329197 [Talaromyces proteolyticus]